MSPLDPRYCNCLHHSTNALSRILTKMADEEFEKAGLTSSYAFLLMSVSDEPGISPSELSEQLSLKPSTITRLIIKMEGKGLLRRFQNGKYIEVYPTKQTPSTVKVVKEAWSNLYRRYHAILGDELTQRLSNDVNETVIKLTE